MATYFGEVLPVSSRAVDDEDDLEAELQGTDILNRREVVLRWSPELNKEISDSNGFLHHNYLIFAIGHIPIAFVRRFLLNTKTKPVGVISCGLDATDKTSVSQDALDDTSCFLYELPLTDGRFGLLCTWNLKATPFQEVLAVDRLFKNVREEAEVTVLSSSRAINYKHENFDECYDNAFIKCLATDSNNRNISFQQLEAPNLVTGISATVMTHCQVQGLFASLFVCYCEDNLRSDSNAVEAFHPLLNIIPFNNFKRLKTVKEEEQSRSVNQFINTNLYI